MGIGKREWRIFRNTVIPASYWLSKISAPLNPADRFTPVINLFHGDLIDRIGEARGLIEIDEEI